MKLIDILARELKEWPKGFDDVGQADSGALHLPGIGMHEKHTDETYTHADDWFTSIVTRAQWQAAVDALKADEQPAFIREGLPNIGTTCEGRVKNGGDWRTYTVKAMSTEYLIVWCEEDLAETPIRHSYWEFRPIRTAEQIAAEERSKAISTMVDACSNPEWVTTYETCAAIYDAGYRKQVQP